MISLGRILKGFEYQTKFSCYSVGDQELWRVLVNSTCWILLIGGLS